MNILEKMKQDAHREAITARYLEGEDEALALECDRFTAAIEALVKRAVEDGLLNGNETRRLPWEAFVNYPYLSGEQATESLRQALAIGRRALREKHTGLPLLLALYHGAYWLGRRDRGQELQNAFRKMVNANRRLHRELAAERARTSSKQQRARK